MKKFFKELYVRIMLDAPLWWIKLRQILFGLSSMCTILVQNGVDFEIKGVSITKIAAWASGGAALMTYLAVKDRGQLNQRMNPPCPDDHDPMHKDNC